MEKMRSDWEGVEFRLTEYKDTGTFIMGGADEIQVRALGLWAARSAAALVVDSLSIPGAVLRGAPTSGAGCHQRTVAGQAFSVWCSDLWRMMTSHVVWARCARDV